MKLLLNIFNLSKKLSLTLVISKDEFNRKLNKITWDEEQKELDLFRNVFGKNIICLSACFSKSFL